jgi:hypothetical protein
MVEVHRKTHLHNDLSSQLLAESNSSRHRKDCPSLQDSIAFNNLKAFWGDDISAQPGNLQEMMLRETALAWIRHRLTISTPKEPAEETQCEYGI